MKSNYHLQVQNKSFVTLHSCERPSRGIVHFAQFIETPSWVQQKQSFCIKWTWHSLTLEFFVCCEDRRNKRIQKGWSSIKVSGFRKENWENWAQSWKFCWWLAAQNALIFFALVWKFCDKNFLMKSEKPSKPRYLGGAVAPVPFVQVKMQLRRFYRNQNARLIHKQLHWNLMVLLKSAIKLMKQGWNWIQWGPFVWKTGALVLFSRTTELISVSAQVSFLPVGTAVLFSSCCGLLLISLPLSIILSPNWTKIAQKIQNLGLQMILMYTWFLPLLPKGDFWWFAPLPVERQALKAASFKSMCTAVSPWICCSILFTIGQKICSRYRMMHQKEFLLECRKTKLAPCQFGLVPTIDRKSCEAGQPVFFSHPCFCCTMVQPLQITEQQYTNMVKQVWRRIQWHSHSCSVAVMFFSNNWIS